MKMFKGKNVLILPYLFYKHSELNHSHGYITSQDIKNGLNLDTWTLSLRSHSNAMFKEY